MMSFHRLSLLTITAALSASSFTLADDLTPRISALQALGQQNMDSILSDPRTGGPQGISIGELPAASAHRQAQRVDAIWAVRAGSTAPIPHIELAHPSHNPNAKGSRPFVSEGPISHTPGYNPRLTPRSLFEYRQLTSNPAPAPQPMPSPTSTAATVPVAAPQTVSTPIFSSSLHEWVDTPTLGNKF
jgi:hypothetical protein